jgi:hypothetical protein
LHLAVNVASLPSVDRIFASALSAGVIHAKLTTTGAIAVYLNTTLVGTSTTVLSTGTWYWIGLRQVTGTSVAFLQINGVDEVTGTATVTATVARVGFSNSEASAVDAYFDDIIIDDATFLAPSKVALLVPISDNARATLWTGGVGGTTSLFDAVNNTPPIGTATETDLTQIEHAGGAAGTTDAYDANMTTYSTAGINSGDTVLAVQLFAAHGEDIATGAKLLAFSVVSNPAIASSGNVTAGDATPTALGTYPTEWGITYGTLTTSPSVTLGTSPVMRSLRPETASRVASVCFMGMNVAWTPAAVPYYRPYPQLLAQ